MTKKALIVEDDAAIVKVVEDTLLGLGHEHESAGNLKDGLRLLESNHFDYVLLDLQIPATAVSGFARIENGRSMLDAIQRVKGNRRLPVIVMTGYHSEALDQTVEMHAAGAYQFISKPFPESGRTLGRVIQDVLAEHGRRFPDATPAANQAPALQPFAGGVLAFYPDHIELCGETIVEKTHRGHAWKLLQILRERSAGGAYVRLSGEKLAPAIQKGFGQNAVAQCVGKLRQRIIDILRDRLGLDCGKCDVIDNRGGGYHLSAKVVVEVHDGPASADVTSSDPCEIGVTNSDVTARNVTSNVTSIAENVTPMANVTSRGDIVTPNERQKWILGELARDVRIVRGDVEKRFNVVARTAKRDLRELVSAGLVEFVRAPHPGYYRLRQRRSAT